MNFYPIDVKTWPRAQMFVYFSQMAPTGYSITVDMDVTRLRKTLKERGRRFFPTYLYLVTKCLNRQQEFKIAYQDKTLGYYETLTPLYASFHEETKTFSLMWTAYEEDYDAFYERYLDNQRCFGKNQGVLSQPQTPPPNAYTVSCVPWISFKHFAVHSYDCKPYFFPSVEAGRIYKNADGRELLPLSLTCHHAAADGYHVNLFLQQLQEEMNTF